MLKIIVLFQPEAGERPGVKATGSMIQGVCKSEGSFLRVSRLD